MNKTFENLYKDWHNATCFSSIISRDEIHYKALEEWCVNNKEEASESFKELLLEEPSHAVGILDKMYPGVLKVEGYVGLEPYCNMWLNILCNKELLRSIIESGFNKDVILNFNSTEKEKLKMVDYYKEYDAYKEYLDKHYIPWNPFHEDDPNVTFEEFKQGKRNKTINE